MQLEDYFDFNTEPVEHIRIKGTRIDIDHVIELYQHGKSPEEIAVHFGCPITVEQAYATILYYLRDPEGFRAYRRRRDEAAERLREAYWNGLSADEQTRQTAHRQRLRELKARFTTPDGRLDLDALRSHVAAETGSALPAGAGA
jgi:uncharacterized protein (DUF433 family)